MNEMIRENMDPSLDRLREALASRNVKQVRALIDARHPADMADWMESLNAQESLALFRFLPKDTAAEFFAFLTIPEQKALIADFNDEELVRLVDDLYVDDAVDLLEELPANAVRSILDNAPATKRSILNRYLLYPEESAAAAMSEEFVRLQPEMTVKEAIEKLRHNRKKLASTSILYVTDRGRRLCGVLSIRELLQARDEKRIEEIMRTHVISATTTDDQEDALDLIRKYSLLALPILDLEGRLVGVLTVDDALDISDEEATEDFEIMAAITPSEKTYFESSVLEQSKNRLPWLFVLLLSGMVTGFILGGFQDAFQANGLLVTFIPMLTGAGGNAGSQSSTMIIRGLAMGEIKVNELLKVLWKELRISLLVGAGLALVCLLRVMLLNPDQTGTALVVSLAVFFIVILAKLCGGLLPVLAKRIGLDPALMAAPLITTVVDALGLLIYFSLATVILKI
uniref:magnesium transporter n=1 Tax=Ndongobacter massiliensis TaxID=1871025 RepID=UPI0009F80E16|nr:magnesium transporter [Ndongobacter massiliensis]